MARSRFTRAELLAAAVRKCPSTRLSEHENNIVKCSLAFGHEADHRGNDPVTGETRTWEL